MAAIAKRKHVQHPAQSDNAIAKKVIEEIAKIDAEAKQKKLAQLDSLEQARENIYERIRELGHQVAQINSAIEKITGKHITAIKSETAIKRGRRDLGDVRDRVGRWLEGRKGQKFGAGDLVREFPELEGVPISTLLKPLTTAGTIKVDTSDGVKRSKYFVPGE